MKLEVPYYSQHNDVKDKSWQKHSCSIVCTYMVLEYIKKKTGGKDDLPSIEDLIYEGFELRGVGTYGWTHDSLVWLAHNHGVLAYKEEFRSLDEDLVSDFRERGIEKVIEKLDAGFPVIVSAIRNWKEENKFHTLTLIGYKTDSITSDSDVRASEKVEGFYYHDPDSDEKEDGSNQFVSIETFKEHWRGLAIFFYE